MYLAVEEFSKSCVYVCSPPVALGASVPKRTRMHTCIASLLYAGTAGAHMLAQFYATTSPHPILQIYLKVTSSLYRNGFKVYIHYHIYKELTPGLPVLMIYDV
jgi:hypothetical protein